MTYLIIGKDHQDGGAKRQQQRTAHLEGASRMKAEGTLLYAAAILEEGKMAGSMMVMKFDSDEELNHWKSTEPYITGEVWATVEITPCAVAPIFS